ncbi:MAG: CPBP family intramembrane metalloprotease [Lactobacillaceae bacterium]|nr:CPBP family intramembrane metalloprotease [Lactobacillaceae bacterium]
MSLPSIDVFFVKLNHIFFSEPILKSVRGNNKIILSQLEDLLINIPGTLVIAPYFEEMIFRYWIAIIENSKIRLFAYSVSSLLFASAHQARSIGRFLILVVFALMSSYIYEKTKRIQYSMLFHSASNLITTVEQQLFIVF